MLCSKLIENLEKITEKYYFFGEINYEKLEFVEDQIIQNKLF